MDVLLSAVKYVFTLVYLDNMLLLSDFSAENNDRAKHALMDLRDAGKALTLMKCNISGKSTDYLETVVRSERYELRHTTDAIKRLKAPWNVTELKSFLWLCNIFIRFVPSFARVPASFDGKLHKGKPFNRSASCYIKGFSMRWMACDKNDFCSGTGVSLQKEATHVPHWFLRRQH